MGGGGLIHCISRLWSTSTLCPQTTIHIRGQSADIPQTFLSAEHNLHPHHIRNISTMSAPRPHKFWNWDPCPHRIRKDQSTSAPQPRGCGFGALRIIRGHKSADLSANVRHRAVVCQADCTTALYEISWQLFMYLKSMALRLITMVFSSCWWIFINKPGQCWAWFKGTLEVH